MFKLKDEILVPDRRLPSCIAPAAQDSANNDCDHHHRVGAISIDLAAPLDVRALFDRARNVFSMPGTATNFWMSADEALLEALVRTHQEAAPSHRSA